jgi:hypothetical protein
MTKILTIILALSLLGCATQTPRPQQQLIVTATVSAPRLISMAEPPTSPQMQFSESWALSMIRSQQASGSAWIGVPICSGTGQDMTCVPSIGDVTLTSRIDPVDRNKGIVDVAISLSNDAEIRTEVGGGKSYLHKHVDKSEEKVSYGVLRGATSVELIPRAVSSIELPHGITVTVEVSEVAPPSLSRVLLKTSHPSFQQEEIHLAFLP